MEDCTQHFKNLLSFLVNAKVNVDKESHVGRGLPVLNLLKSDITHTDVMPSLRETNLMTETPGDTSDTDFDCDFNFGLFSDKDQKATRYL